jgi:hypothetical protein
VPLADRCGGEAVRISFGACGRRSEDVAAVVEQAKRASSMHGNPVVLTDEELVGALGAAL